MSATESNCILACIDNSELANAVIDHAIWLAKTTQLPLTFLHTIEHSHHSDIPHHEGNLTPNMKESLLDELSDEERTESKRLLAEGKLMLTKAKQKALQASIENVSVTQRHGLLIEALHDLESTINMVVLGSKGEDHLGNKKGLGSQLEAAVKAIHTPVFIVKSEFIEPKKMMIAYNGSPTSKKALALLAKDNGLASSVELHIVSVQADLADAEALSTEAKSLIGTSDIITAAFSGEAINVLNQYQADKQIDITMMGAFSHGKIHGLVFGSFTTRMLLEMNSHFLLVR
ncbi:MAG: hypothetical protein COA90_04300 [Gammaproteobacteria bacterium]|nr:MAG: hypothetical protein COA90_04300 [Gammaproteobacteria bacterium]